MGCYVTSVFVLLKADEPTEQDCILQVKELNPNRWTDEGLSIFEKINLFVEERANKYLGRPKDSLLLPSYKLPMITSTESSIQLEENRKIHELFYDIPRLHEAISSFNREILQLEKSQLLLGKSKQERFAAVYDPISLELKEHPAIESWRHRVLIDHTPCGNVFMYYDVSRLAFAYFAAQTVPYDVLNAVALKYVHVFKCLDFYVDETRLPWPKKSCGEFPEEVITEEMSATICKAPDAVKDPKSEHHFTKLSRWFANYFVLLGKYRNSFLTELRKYHELPPEVGQKNSFVFVDKPEHMLCFQSFTKKRKNKQRFMHANMKTEVDMQFSHENHNGHDDIRLQNVNPYLAFAMKSSQHEKDRKSIFITEKEEPLF
jgi:hypothetical protein